MAYITGMLCCMFILITYVSLNKLEELCGCTAMDFSTTFVCRVDGITRAAEITIVLSINEQPHCHDVYFDCDVLHEFIARYST